MKALEEVVGQRELVGRLRVICAGARLRGVTPPHVLLSGPPGYGKSTLSRIVADELGAELVQTSGPAMRRAADVAGLVLGADPDGSTVLFLDEVHRLPVVVAETLYEVLQDRTLSVTTGSGSDARAFVLPVPAGLTVMGATTEPGRMPAPFRDRFGFHGTMTPYSLDELATIVRRHWERAAIAVEDGTGDVVAERCKGVPRVALHLAERVADFAAVIGESPVTVSTAVDAMRTFGIRDDGLDDLDWRLLEALVRTFANRPVGLDALAQALDVDQSTIQREHEGPLVRAGLVIRTRAGRMATPTANALIREGG